MNKIKRILSLTLALVMVLSMAACGGGETTETTAATVQEQFGETVNYTVSVQANGGRAMSGVDIYIYADETLADLKQYGETGEDGTASFTMPESGDYAIVLSGVPDGYAVEPH